MPQRILIVDDNHEVVRATRLRLQAAGYDTLAAYDGDGCVNSAAADHPDAIVLDIRMPIRDGLSALTELKQREDTREIPVLMLSASIVDQPQALKLGARHFLRKPHSGRQLVEALELIAHN